MRDPWLPLVMLSVAVVTVWLGIVGPLPHGITGWIRDWQTLIGVGVALVAAFIAFHNTNRSLEHASRLEAHRRARKLAAVRAVLPLALAQVSSYAEQSAQRLDALLDKCVGEALPFRTVPSDIVQRLPSETLKTLTEFIEYSDCIDVSIVEMTVASIQIHDSRLGGMVQDNHDPSESHIIVQNEIEGRIIDAASIYAGAAAVYLYARRQDDTLSRSVPWDGVRSALRNMRFYDDEYPRVFRTLEGYQNNSFGPFERFARAEPMNKSMVVRSLS